MLHHLHKLRGLRSLRSALCSAPAGFPSRPSALCPAAASPRRCLSQLPSAHMQPLTGSSSSAVQLYDEALSCYLDLRGDPIGLLKRATSEDPSLLAGHLLTAALYLLSTGHGGCEAAVLRARKAGCALKSPALT